MEHLSVIPATDHAFVNDCIILAQSLEALVVALKILREEASPLGLFSKIPWTKTKVVRVFGGLLDETVLSALICGEDIEDLESFTYLGGVWHSSGGHGK